MTDEDVTWLEKSRVRDVERKGKLLRLVMQPLEAMEKDSEDETLDDYLYLHMGMTGRISNPDYIPSLESLSDKDSYPPPHTHLILKTITNKKNEYQVSYSDPRRFGAVSFGRTSSLHVQWETLAMDAMNPQATIQTATSKLVGHAKGIKATLLNQRAIVSGIGNWIADEVLYQSEIHPDQKYLNQEEVSRLEHSLKFVLETANDCLKQGHVFPSDWIFHVRWSKSSKDAKTNGLTDSKGRKVTFLKSGGRTSAIVPSIQQLQIQGRRTTNTTSSKAKATKSPKQSSQDPKGGGNDRKRILESSSTSKIPETTATANADVVKRRSSNRIKLHRKQNEE